MQCPRCGANLPAGATSCGSCGAKFQQGKRCPNCQSVIPSNAAVCPKCGARFAGQAAGTPVQKPPKVKGGFRWWRIPIYIVVFSIGVGVGCAYTRYSILSSMKSAFSRFASSSQSDSNSKPRPQSETPSHGEINSDENASGNLGDFNISILTARRSVDYEGKAAVIVKYQFKNNSDKNQTFMTAVNDRAFQKGVQLDGAIITGDERYTALDSAKEVQPNGSIELEQAYLVTDTASDITIEVTELFSISSNDKLSKTFHISDLQ